jgi:sialic acid synthase SpsE
MAQIILDFGSGGTCKNYILTVRRMIDELKAVDTGKHTITIKWQLFKDAPPNIPLQLDVFDYAYNYANENGYQTTASVFDMDSLRFLLTYDIPFVKIANRPDLYWLAGEVPRKIPVYVSFGNKFDFIDNDCPLHTKVGKSVVERICCISSYPATIEQYESEYNYPGVFVDAPVLSHLWRGISDHTTDFTLYHKYKPEIYECHYKLDDSAGPDAGEFSRTAAQLSEIL